MRTHEVIFFFDGFYAPFSYELDETPSQLQLRAKPILIRVLFPFTSKFQ